MAAIYGRDYPCVKLAIGEVPKSRACPSGLDDARGKPRVPAQDDDQWRCARAATLVRVCRRS